MTCNIEIFIHDLLWSAHNQLCTVSTMKSVTQCPGGAENNPELNWTKRHHGGQKHCFIPPIFQMLPEKWSPRQEVIWNSQATRVSVNSILHITWWLGLQEQAPQTPCSMSINMGASHSQCHADEMVTSTQSTMVPSCPVYKVASNGPCFSLISPVSMKLACLSMLLMLDLTCTSCCTKPAQWHLTPSIMPSSIKNHAKKVELGSFVYWTFR